MRDIDNGTEALVQAQDVSARASAVMACKLQATTQIKSKASLQTNPQIWICLQDVVWVHVRAFLRVRTHHVTRVGSEEAVACAGNVEVQCIRLLAMASWYNQVRRVVPR